MENTNRPVPVDTGKVKIGVHYIPDTRPQLSEFEERLQMALLGEDNNRVSRFLDQHPRLAPWLVLGALVAFMGLVGFIEHH